MTNPDCELCGQSSTGDGWIVVNGRLYCDPVCDFCRDDHADDLVDRLEHADVDEATRRKAVKKFITHLNRVAYDEPPEKETIEDALDHADVDDSITIQVLDALRTQEDLAP